MEAMRGENFTGKYQICIPPMRLTVSTNTKLQVVEGSYHPRGGGTQIFSHIHRLCPFFWVQNSEFQYFLGFSEK